MSRSRSTTGHLRCGGCTNAQAIYVSGTVASIVGNTLTGCGSSVYVGNSGAGLASSSAATDHRAGHGERCGDPHPIGQRAGCVGNQITGGAHSAPSGGHVLPQEFTRARVDSNTIQNVPDRAIYVAYADTLIAPAVYRWSDPRIRCRADQRVAYAT